MGPCWPAAERKCRIPSNASRRQRVCYRRKCSISPRPRITNTQPASKTKLAYNNWRGLRPSGVESEKTERTVLYYREFLYKLDSWSCAYQVVVKMESPAGHLSSADWTKGYVRHYISALNYMNHENPFNKRGCSCYQAERTNYSIFPVLTLPI